VNKERKEYRESGRGEYREKYVQGEGEYREIVRTGGGSIGERDFLSQIMRDIPIPHFLTVIQITATSQRNGKN